MGADRQQIGNRYQLEEQLVSEGSLTVYRALDAQTGRRIELHLYGAETAWRHDPRLDPRLCVDEVSELLAGASSSHVQVPSGHLDLADGPLAILYPWIEGQRLNRRLEASPLAPDKALELGIDLCQALDALHRSGIVHRDIKPRNVILTDSGAVLGGLELAQTPRDLRASGPPGRHPGTQAYMSPEQATTSGPLDGRSDLFSLGVMLVEALGESPGAAVLASAPHQDLAGYGAFGRILLRMLQRDPARRYQTARDLQRDLQRLTRGSVGARLGLTARQRPGVVWAVGGLSALALIWTLLGTGTPAEGASFGGSHSAYGSNIPIAWVIEAASDPAPQAEVSVAQITHEEAAVSRDLPVRKDAAVELAVGQFVERAFEEADQVHHASIRVAGGRSYMVATANLAPGVDTYLGITYNGQRVTNDDAWPGTLASRAFVAPGQDATLWVEVTNRGISGADASYELLIVEAEPTATPTTIPTATLTPRAGVTMTPRPTYTPGRTATRSPRATRTPRPTSTRQATRTPRPTVSPTPSVTRTPLPTSRPTATATPPRTVLPVKTATTPVW